MNDRPKKSDVETFLDEAFLRKLEKLKILARHTPGGPARGERPSWRSGASVEFLDYRKYQIGDDLRYVDWNVYGRLDKLFIKLFRAERNQTVHLLLDMSRSMAFGAPPKQIAAKKIAAAVAYICLTNMNQVELCGFADDIKGTKRQSGGRGAYLPMLGYLLSLETGDETDIDASLSHYAATSRQPGAMVIISDLLDPKGFERGIRALRFARFDISLIQVLDHEERYPSLGGQLMLKDMETHRVKRLTMDRKLREVFRKKVDGFIQGNHEICRRNGIDFHLYDTRMPFEDFLIRYVTQGVLFR